MNFTSAHSFPEFDSSRSNGSVSSGDDESVSFKPLYRSGQDRRQETDTVDCADAADMARKKGYDLGFDAGCKDAGLLVQQEIAPQVKALSEEFVQLEDFFKKLTENSATHISQIALRMAEKILGEPTRFEPADLDSFAGDLKSRMVRAYRLDLVLNHEDKDNLTNLLAAKNPIRKQSASIVTLSDRADVRSGELHAENDKASLSFDDLLSESLDKVLAEVSTK